MNFSVDFGKISNFELIVSVYKIPIIVGHIFQKIGRSIETVVVFWVADSAYCIRILIRPLLRPQIRIYCLKWAKGWQFYDVFHFQNWVFEYRSKICEICLVANQKPFLLEIWIHLIHSDGCSAWSAPHCNVKSGNLIHYHVPASLSVQPCWVSTSRHDFPLQCVFSKLYFFLKERKISPTKFCQSTDKAFDYYLWEIWPNLNIYN